MNGPPALTGVGSARMAPADAVAAEPTSPADPSSPQQNLGKRKLSAMDIEKVSRASLPHFHGYSSLTSSLPRYRPRIRSDHACNR
jgi:hypothetical protein